MGARLNRPLSLVQVQKLIFICFIGIYKHWLHFAPCSRARLHRPYPIVKIRIVGHGACLMGLYQGF
ncbi:hypothetical protein BVH74_06775 [Halopseudomonas phragmitis]|uniref:Uncharacterized protein n=2 Tax=Pseudomonadaceae TaxID=135621 RepID=A0A1V0B3F7_9GAMM|nr:hypothetical protein BVH74_06775 [Halopseudomonas phragmitis]RHW22337.1 hypothetical protein C2846_04780 [Pseudomonas jilinensis]